MLEIYDLEEGEHYLCQTTNNTLVVLAYLGNQKFDCGQYVNSIKCVVKKVNIKIDLMDPTSFYDNIVNTPQYIEYYNHIKKSMEKGLVKICNSTPITKEIKDRISDDLRNQGWWVRYHSSRYVKKGYWVTDTTFEWSNEKKSFLDRVLVGWKSPK